MLLKIKMASIKTTMFGKKLPVPETLELIRSDSGMIIAGRGSEVLGTLNLRKSGLEEILGGKKARGAAGFSHFNVREAEFAAVSRGVDSSGNEITLHHYLLFGSPVFLTKDNQYFISRYMPGKYVIPSDSLELTDDKFKEMTDENREWVHVYDAGVDAASSQYVGLVDMEFFRRSGINISGDQITFDGEIQTRKKTKDIHFSGSFIAGSLESSSTDLSAHIFSGAIPISDIKLDVDYARKNSLHILDRFGVHTEYKDFRIPLVDERSYGNKSDTVVDPGNVVDESAVTRDRTKVAESIGRLPTINVSIPPGSADTDSRKAEGDSSKDSLDKYASSSLKYIKFGAQVIVGLGIALGLALCGSEVIRYYKLNLGKKDSSRETAIIYRDGGVDVQVSDSGSSGLVSKIAPPLVSPPRTDAGISADRESNLDAGSERRHTLTRPDSTSLIDCRRFGNPTILDDNRDQFGFWIDTLDNLATLAGDFNLCDDSLNGNVYRNVGSGEFFDRDAHYYTNRPLIAGQPIYVVATRNNPRVHSRAAVPSETQESTGRTERLPNSNQSGRRARRDRNSGAASSSHDCGGAFSFLNRRPSAPMEQDIFRHSITAGDNAESVAALFNRCDDEGRIVYGRGDEGRDLYETIHGGHIVDAGGNPITSLEDTGNIYVTARRNNPRTAVSIQEGNTTNYTVTTLYPPFRQGNPLFDDSNVRRLIVQSREDTRMNPDGNFIIRYVVDIHGDIVPNSIAMESASTASANAFGNYLTGELRRGNNHYPAALDGLYRSRVNLQPVQR